MSGVTELGYVGLNITDTEAWRLFATELVGCEWVEGESPGLHHLRLDDWHHRLSLHHGAEDDLAYIGWRMADQQSLEAVTARLEGHGHSCRVCSQDEADERHVMGLVKVNSPGGVATELFWGPQLENHKPFYPGRRMFGHFRTGALGLGHVTIFEPDADAAYGFYRLLGFQGNRQYKVRLPNGIVARPFFMRCNDRQHSLQFDLGPMEKKINHLAIEYADLRDLGLARDIVRQRGIDVPLDLGMHANDHAFSFYAGNPSGWACELAWNGRKAPVQDEYYTWDIFGHERLATGYGLDLDTTLPGAHEAKMR